MGHANDVLIQYVYAWQCREKGPASALISHIDGCRNDDHNKTISPLVFIPLKLPGRTWDNNDKVEWQLVLCRAWTETPERVASHTNCASGRFLAKYLRRHSLLYGQTKGSINRIIMCTTYQIKDLIWAQLLCPWSWFWTVVACWGPIFIGLMFFSLFIATATAQYLINMLTFC